MSTSIPADGESSAGTTSSMIEQGLAVGRALEQAGRLVDALAEYDRVQSLRPDPELAYRIVHLRQQSIEGAHFPPGPASWPRVDIPDPFPGQPGPPEVDAASLTGETLGGAILHHGCLVVRGFHDPVRANHLREMVVRSLDARDRAVAGHCEPGDDMWYRRFLPGHWDTGRERHWLQRSGGMLMADSPLVMWDVLDGYVRSGAVQAIHDYLGERPVLSSHKSVLRRVRETVPTWHQDGSFMGSDVRSVDLWLALTHCGPGTGARGLDILPKRVEEILETETHGAVTIAIQQDLVDRTGADRSWVGLNFEPGDAIFFDERFVHRTGSIDSATATRYAIESWFFAASTVPESYAPILV